MVGLWYMIWHATNRFIARKKLDICMALCGMHIGCFVNTNKDLLVLQTMVSAHERFVFFLHKQALSAYHW